MQCYGHIAQCLFFSWICNLFKDNRIRWRLFSNEYSSFSALKPFLQKSWASVLRRCISCRNNWEGSKKRGCSCFQGFQAMMKREREGMFVQVKRNRSKSTLTGNPASLCLQRILGIVSYLCVASRTSTAIRAVGEPWKWHGWTGLEMVIR